MNRTIVVPLSICLGLAMGAGGGRTGHGGLIAFTRTIGNKPSDVYVMNADGSGVRNLTHSPTSSAYAPAWSPDGKRITFVSDRGTSTGSHVFLIDADGKGLRQLTHGRGEDHYPSWSPDGKEIGFLHNGRLQVMNADGRNQRSLATKVLSFRWSPDGRAIAFVKGTGIRDRFFIINRDGRSQRFLTEGGWLLDWSPDGGTIAYHLVNLRSISDPVDGYVINTDGSHKQLLARNAAGLVYSPNGRRIAFARLDTESDLQLIYVMNADGSGQRRLSRLPSQVGLISWSPDGTLITFETFGRVDLGDKKIHFRPYEIDAVHPDGSGLHTLISNATEIAWQP